MGHESPEETKPQIPEQAKHAYGIKTNRFLGGFESWIYEYDHPAGTRILRITPLSHRCPDQIRAELDWVRYLGENGLSVSKPVPTLDGRWVFHLDEGDSAGTAAAFLKAPGKPPTNEDWDTPLFRNMGEFVGKMHALTKAYTPLNPQCRRPEWREELDDCGDRYLDRVDDGIAKRFWENREYLDQLPKGPDSFGLVHSDVHRGNFFLDRGKITLFDFDDSTYSWFVEDIALALFYAVFPGTEERRKDAPRFYEAFLEGYARMNALSSQWLKEIPFFMKKRELLLYLVLTGRKRTDHPFMKGRKERLLEDLPVVEIPF
ncbi:Ser/Thr protein kinase RdoA (MazF antagonist) [Melghirimyces profundicolus]|uniref:Ser/Thr protein kinase RdoA (MazF antagonist) n=1 Tax=Melghirimyces profundicolus TaxID=1242148 RepID=A0A2T6BXI4_9BACL|nr:phosphotransferase [Melghirimyces profundicolus]PTX60784.1 Ser/Thr protein kinase RdoA (MazF antagonist) [Melghirimyces profundicolus]